MCGRSAFAGCWEEAISSYKCYVSKCHPVHAAQVSITPRGVFGGWLAGVPMAGTVAPGGVSAIKLTYDISQNEFQGVNTADILLTTTARPLAKARRSSMRRAAATW